VKTTSAAPAIRGSIARGDSAQAYRTLLLFSEDLCLAGDHYDYISEVTYEEPALTGSIPHDAALAAFSEIHRQLVGLPHLDWIKQPERYADDLSAINPREIVDKTIGAYDGFVHPTLLEHSVVIRGASLAAFVEPGSAG
jgi:hypothetical protein